MPKITVNYENSESHLENADLCVLNPILGLQIFSLCDELLSAAESLIRTALSDPGQPGVHITGKQQRRLEDQGEAGEEERDLLSPEEEAIIEPEQLSITIGSAVKRREDEAEPAQSGLDHPRIIFLSSRILLHHVKLT